MNEEKTYTVTPIGTILRQEKGTFIRLEKEYVRGLKEIEHFSHLRLFRQLPGEAAVGLSTVILDAVDQETGTLKIREPGLPSGTPVLDLKAYMPSEDRVRNYRLPGRLNETEEWFEPPAPPLPESDAAGTAVPSSLILTPAGKIEKKKSRTFLRLNADSAGIPEALEEYSHINLIWYCNRFNMPALRKILVCTPPYEAPKTGVFASRSPVRPNPLALTVCPILEVDRKNRRIELAGCDAFDGTPVIGFRPYLPVLDRVREPALPPWLSHWPLWLSDGEEKTARPENIRPAELRSLEYFSRNEEVHPSAPAAAPGRKTGTGITSEAGDRITLCGVRQNNLKNINVSIPLNKLTVVTGVSGSGKSSLAFDTLFAESQRRYMQSLSSASRSAAGQMEKPDFDLARNLLPAVAIGQTSLVRNPRTTVGSASEVYSLLRLLYARLGTRYCSSCGRELSPRSAGQAAEMILNLLPGTEVSLIPGREPVDAEEPVRLTIPEDARRDKDLYRQVRTAVSECYSRGSGFLTLEIDGQERLRITERAACTSCGAAYFKMTPSLFSYNSPAGMCSECSGLGIRLEVDPEKLITDPERSLMDGASPWYGDLRKHLKKPNANWFRGEILALAQAMDVDLEKPWRELPEEFREKALYGTGDEKYTFTYSSPKTGRTGTIERPVGGAVNHIRRLFSNSRAGNSHEVYRQFLTEQPCPVCEGERLSPQGRFVRLGGKRYPEAAGLSVAEAAAWAETLSARLSEKSRTLAGTLLEELTERLDALLRTGLSYLPLDRPANTLSGGEAQRIKLAGQLECGLSGLLYVLDEPSAGLHPRDHGRMIETMRKLRDTGNTIVVVEHDEATMRAADHIIDIGPGAGIKGGRIIAEGSPREIEQNGNSLTGRFLSGRKTVSLDSRAERQPPRDFLTIEGAALHNLKEISVSFPLERVSCVTGVSGSGKSSLIRGTLVPALIRKLDGGEAEAGPYSRISGLEQLDKVLHVDQSSIGLSPRSVPLTYIGIFDEIRNLFARTEEARRLGFTSSRFSFNDKEGRCSACEGLGKIRVDMSFLPDTWIPCSECDGRRYNRETLDITLREKSVADVLEMDVQEALEFFAGEKKIRRYLQTLHDVGLDYLKLGQSAATLSGGEAQRIKLARELVRPDTGQTLYVLDEPTSGLHFADIRQLLTVLHRLTEPGNTVIIIEHNPDVIRTSHWVVDLGPEGGEAGGCLMGQGTPRQIAGIKESYTGQVLKDIV